MWTWSIIDSFESSDCATSSDLRRRYLLSGTPFIKTTEKVVGSHSIGFGNAEEKIWHSRAGGHLRSWHVGFWFYQDYGTSDEASTNGDPLIEFKVADGDEEVQVARTFPGYIRWYRDGFSQVADSMSDVRIPPRVWHYLELFYRIDDNSSPAGKVIAQVNGVEVFNHTGWSYYSSNHLTNGFVIGSPAMGSGRYLYIDSIWARCSRDLENTPTFFGPCYIKYLTPDADSATHSSWTPTSSPAVGYTEIDETAGTDDGTTNISSSTNGHISTFSHSTLSLNANEDIKCVAVTQSLAKTSVGGGAFRTKCRTGGSDYNGKERYHGASTQGSPTSQYTIHQQFWDTVPGSSPEAAWTVSDVNNAEFGIEYLG